MLRGDDGWYHLGGWRLQREIRNVLFVGEGVRLHLSLLWASSSYHEIRQICKLVLLNDKMSAFSTLFILIAF